MNMNLPWAKGKTKAQMDREMNARIDAFLIAAGVDPYATDEERTTGWVIEKDAPVKATCWCERSVVTITIRQMLAFRTESCGRAKCK